MTNAQVVLPPRGGRVLQVGLIAALGAVHASLALMTVTSSASCARSVSTDAPVAPVPSPVPSPAPAPSPGFDASASSADAAPSATATADATAIALAPASLEERTDGPHELPLAPGRSIFYARPRETAASRAGRKPWRVVGHLHGICYPPSYSAGRWLGAAVDVGVLVTPTGNAHCGDAGIGPPSWEAPTWEELVTTMDADLERSIAKVEAKHPGSIRRDGAVLTGFSRGAYATPVIARMHPGRWPYLVLIEANVPLSVASLRKSGVRAVALLAGEVGTEIAGMRKTQAELEQAGFPSRLYVMPRVGHLYPDDMERIMGEALDFVLAH
jgi:hypothetical protein